MPCPRCDVNGWTVCGCHEPEKCSVCKGTNREPCSRCSSTAGPFDRFLRLRALFLIIVAAGIASLVVLMMVTLYVGVFIVHDVPLVPNAVLSVIIAALTAWLGLGVLAKGIGLWRQLTKDPGLASLVGRKHDDLAPKEQDAIAAIGLAHLLILLTAFAGIGYELWSMFGSHGQPSVTVTSEARSTSSGPVALPTGEAPDPSRPAESAPPRRSTDGSPSSTDVASGTHSSTATALPDTTIFDLRSPNGRRTVQLVLRNQRYYFCVDGAWSPPYEDVGIDPPVFSPDSKHLAYVVHRDGRLAVVLDGKESASYLDIAAANAYSRQGGTMVLGPKNPDPEGAKRSGLVFSPDSKRLAYAAWTAENQMAVVVDGTPGPLVETVSINGIYFSPDSRHVAYVARRAGAWHVVVDGQMSNGYPEIGNDGLGFSNDWRRVSFQARVDGAWKTVSWAR